MVDSLLWWTLDAVSKRCKFREPHRMVITMDASLFGWGAHLGPHMAQGQWSPQEQTLNINVLELWAVYLALLSFQHHVLDLDVLVLMDNVSAKAYVNWLGGTRSRALMHETLHLGLWAEAHLTSLRAERISGAANVLADSLSQSPIDQAEWSLHPLLFKELVDRFGSPSVDLFASKSNHRLPCFFTCFPSPGAEVVDALRSPWHTGLLLYAFPPTTDTSGSPETPGGEGRAASSGPLLAAPPVVCGLGVSFHGTPLEGPRRSDLFGSGAPGSPRSPILPTGCLEIEQFLMTEALISLGVVSIIQASCRASTT